MDSAPKSKSSSKRSDSKSTPPSSPIPNSASKTPMPSPGSSRAPRKRGSRNADEEDSIIILTAFADFKKEHGRKPTQSSMVALQAALDPSLHNHLNADRLYNKFRALRDKYYKVAKAGGPRSDASPYERSFFHLADEVWGLGGSDLQARKPKLETSNGGNHHPPIGNGDVDEEAKVKEEAKEGEVEEEEGNDGGDDHDDDDSEDEEFDWICETYKCFVHEMRKVWEGTGMQMSDFRLAIKQVDRKRMKKMEKKWRKHYKKSMELKRASLEMEQMVVDAILAEFDSEEEEQRPKAEAEEPKPAETSI